MHEKRFDGEIERLRAPERVDRLEVEHVVELSLGRARIERVLDVGTGSGLFAQAFAARGLQVSGVDVSPGMLAAARSFVPTGDFREGVAESLPYPDRAFDLVFMGVVLHEVDDTLKALQEALRVARQRTAILEWPYREQTLGPPLEHRLDPAKLKTLFKEAGAHSWKTKELSETVLYLLEK